MNQDEFSFKPHINDMSRMLGRPKNEKAEDCLINYGRAVRERMEQRRCEQAMMELSQCRFQPAITRKSEMILSERGRPIEEGADKFDSLYNDARRR